MSSFRHIIRQARRRELIDRTIGLGGRGLVWGIAAAITVLLVDRLAGLTIPTNTYLLLPAVGFLVGSILAQLSQPAELEVAVRLDRKLRLKDRIGTARSLEDSHHPADPEFAEFVQTQAEQVASSLDVRSATPIRVGGVWSAAGALALLLWLGVVLMPSVDWLGRSKSVDVPQPDPQTLQQAQEVSRSIEQVVKDLPQDNQLDQQSIEDLQSLDRLAQQLSNKPAPLSAEAVAEARDESAAKLYEVADRVAAQAERDLAASDEVAKRFAGMEKTGEPKPPLTAQQFEEALKRGDFGEAAQRLDALNKSHEEGTFTPAQQKAAAEQLREIAKQLDRPTSPSADELAEQREQLAQAMRDQGLDQQVVEELLDDPPSQEQIEQELRDRNVDPEVAREMARDLDRLREKQEVNEQADRDTRDVKESLEKAAEKLQQPSPSTPPSPQQQPPSASQPSPASSSNDQKPPQSSATQPQGEQSQPPSPDQAREQQSDKQSKSSESQQDRSSEKSQGDSQQKDDSKNSDQQQGHSSTEARQQQQQQQSDQNQSNQQSEKTISSEQRQQDSQQTGERKQGEQSRSGTEKTQQQSSPSGASQDQQQQTQNGKGSQQQTSAGKDGKQQSPQQQGGESSSPADALRRLAQRQEKAHERQQISEQMRQAARELAQKMTPQEREEWAKQWQRENPPDQGDSTQKEKSQPQESEVNQQQPDDSQQGNQNTDRNAPDEKLTEKDIQSLREMARDIYEKMTPEQRKQLAEQMQKAMESQQQQQKQQQQPQPDQQSQQDESQKPGDQASPQNPQPNQQNVQKDMESLMKFAQQMYDQMTPQQREQLAEQMNKMRAAQQKSDAAESSSARSSKGKPNGKGSGSRAGDQASSPTRGKAETLDIDKTEDVDLRGNEAGDRLIAQWLTEETPGDSPRPARSVADATQQVQQAQKVAERAVDDAAVPKGYHKLIKRYFGKLPQTVEQAANPKPVAPAATQPGG